MRRQTPATIPAHDLIDWDIITWQRALECWKQRFKQIPAAKPRCGLEIGANTGGLSLFFAHEFGANMCCSDLANPLELARTRHKKYDVQHLIEYAVVDATRIPFPPESFDFVVFKSVLGVIGAKDQVKRMEQAMSEMHRVLKPGGTLFFAENLRGSIAHRLARRWFRTWGKNWRYLDTGEMEQLLGNFATREIHTTGFLAAFVPKPEWLKNIVARVDPLFSFLPKNWRYVAFGFAVKQTSLG